MGSLQKLLEKYHMEKWFQRENLVVLILAGILLVIIAIPVKEQEKEISTERELQIQLPDENNLGEYERWYDYAAYLEKKLEEILGKVKGVGMVSVMITLEASEEIITQKDESVVMNETMEQDSQGGSRTVSGIDRKEETVYQKSEGKDVPYIAKTKLPEIGGILVVAQGAGNATVKKKITEIAGALFSVEAHKITVVEMD